MQDALGLLLVLIGFDGSTGICYVTQTLVRGTMESLTMLTEMPLAV